MNGQTGSGTAEQPYDQGNNDSEIFLRVPLSKHTINVVKPEVQQSTMDRIKPESNITPNSSNITGDSSTGSSDIKPNTSADIPTDSENPATASTTPAQKQQGADRPTEEPSAKETQAISSEKKAGEETQDTSASDSTPKITSDEEREKLAEEGGLPHDPNDHSGEPMHMHTGGKTDPEGGSEGETMNEKTERSASVSHEGGGEHGKEKGTGEQWVKTSGIAAEGGDFDATKPGAGREATRKCQYSVRSSSL